MTIFIISKEFKGQSSELENAILSMKTTEACFTNQHSEVTSPIMIFPRQGVFLDTASICNIDNLKSNKQLDSVYIPDFHDGLIIHIRNEDNSSYTAHVDLFTAIDWEKIINLFSKGRNNDEKLRLQIDIGYMKISTDDNCYQIIQHIISHLSLSLYNYLKNKEIIVNFMHTYLLGNNLLLESSNSINLMINLTNGTLSSCGQKNNIYYPINLFPIDKALLNIRLCDYSKTNEILLIYNINTSLLDREKFDRHCSNLSDEYKKAIINSKSLNNYDLSFLIDYIKICFMKLLRSKFNEDIFNRYLIIYMKYASQVFTALKIFPDIIKLIFPEKLPVKFPTIRQRSNSDGEMPTYNEKRHKPKLEMRKSNEQYKSQLLTWMKPEPLLNSISKNDDETSNRTCTPIKHS